MFLSDLKNRSYALYGDITANDRASRDLQIKPWSFIRAFLVLVLAVVNAGGNALKYLDVGGALIVVGGSFAALLINYSWEEVCQALVTLRESYSDNLATISTRITTLIGLAQEVRQGDPVVLEDRAIYEKDQFLKVGLELIIDGTSPENIRSLLEHEIRLSELSQKRSYQLIESLAGYAPSMGLIGTLIGLIQMLGHIGEVKEMGVAMSLALVATLYGTVIANMILLPLAGRIKHRMGDHTALKTVTLEGIVALARKESSYEIESKLRTMLLQSTRNRVRL